MGEEKDEMKDRDPIQGLYIWDLVKISAIIIFGYLTLKLLGVI